MIEIKVNNADEISQALKNLAKGLRFRKSLMNTLAGTMQSAVDQNFAEGGRPKWLGVKHRDGTPLTDSGHLKNSIRSKTSNDSAIVGTNVKYAAIHQYGGENGTPSDYV